MTAPTLQGRFGASPIGAGNLLFVQMHGEPGSGKSTVARAIGAAIGAVVIDKDLLSTAAIRAEGLPTMRASGVAYETAWLLLPSLLAQGFSVVFDSPCFWPNIEERGRAIAAAHGARYAMIECACTDETELDRRLASRSRIESQQAARIANELRPGMYRPSCERLMIDTTRPLADMTAEAAEWLRPKQSAIRNPQSAIPAAVGGAA